MSQPSVTQPGVVTASQVRAVAVIGAGTMGHGIAQVAAQAGLAVVLQDVSPQVLDSGLARIRDNLDKGVALGKVTSEARAAALARLRGEPVLAAAVRDAQVVIEAVPERLSLKQELFAAVSAAAPASALLASNTSSLSVAEIASAASDPGRVVGMHFFNPVHLMKLVEIVHHERSSPAAIACATELAGKLGKTAICVRDVPGFASSRLGLVLGLEAIRMLESEVASARDIDTAMKLGYGHPMGPLELTDLVGLDVRLHIAEYLATALGPHFQPPELLRRLVRDGKLGRKSGEGFYRWVDGKKVE
jgi:3-hydroxybutyryl-CoA dehydrogenase